MISFCNTVSWCIIKQPKLTRSKARFEVSIAMTFRITVFWDFAEYQGTFLQNIRNW